MRRSVTALLATVVTALALAAPAGAETVGTIFPSGFPTIVDASLGIPVLGFGAAGPVERTPVIFLHGNNDTPYPTLCNPYGNMHDFAQYFLDHGYSASELWGLGYQGDHATSWRTRLAARAPRIRRWRTSPTCAHLSTPCSTTPERSASTSSATASASRSRAPG
jgi:hypothetical protein